MQGRIHLRGRGGQLPPLNFQGPICPPSSLRPLRPTEIVVVSSLGSFRLDRNLFMGAKPISSVALIWLFFSFNLQIGHNNSSITKKAQLDNLHVLWWRVANQSPKLKQILFVRMEERREKKKSEQFAYLVASVMSSLGITS